MPKIAVFGGTGYLASIIKNQNIINRFMKENSLILKTTKS